jgi:hypothetical protein
MGAPIEYRCDFPECGAEASYGFREPGIENLVQNNPAAIEVWCCDTHRDAGAAMLQARVEARGRERATALKGRAMQAEGRLL